MFQKRGVRAQSFRDEGGVALEEEPMSTAQNVKQLSGASILREWKRGHKVKTGLTKGVYVSSQRRRCSRWMIAGSFDNSGKTALFYRNKDVDHLDEMLIESLFPNVQLREYLSVDTTLNSRTGEDSSESLWKSPENDLVLFYTVVFRRTA